MIAVAARRVGRALADAATSLARGWRSSVLALLAIVCAVLVLGAFLVISRAVDAVVTRWMDAAEVSVFLSDDAGPAERAAIARALGADPIVREVRVVTAEEAARRFAREFPDLAPLAAAGGELSLPASLEARLSRDAGDAAVAALVERVGGLAGVADVRADRELLSRLSAAARTGRWLAGTLTVILVLAAAMAIVSVVRLAYVSRLDEVEVLLLVGAPLSAVRGPFVIEGALQGALGTAIALAALRVALDVAGALREPAIAGLRLEFLPASLVAALVAGGGLLGAAAGFAAATGGGDRVKD
jgi:cell division transport system permease protein